MAATVVSSTLPATSRTPSNSRNSILLAFITWNVPNLCSTKVANQLKNLNPQPSPTGPSYPLIAPATLALATKICGRRSSSSLNAAYNPAKEAKEEVKQCEFFSLPINEDCPLGAFMFNVNGTGERVPGLKYNYNVLRVAANQMPLSGFTIGFDYICDQSGSIVMFQYLDHMVKHECATNHTSFKRVSLPVNEITYEHLLRLNNKYADYNKYFNSPPLINESVNLFAQTFTHFNYIPGVCDIADKSFIADLKIYIANDLTELHLVSQVIVGLMAGIFGFAVPLVYLASFVGCDFKLTQLQVGNEHFKDLAKFWLAAKMVNEILCTIALASNYGYQVFMMDRVEAFINNQCTEEAVTRQLREFDDIYLVRVYNYVLLDFILCLIVMVIDFQLTYMFWKYIDEQKEDVKKMEDQNLIETEPIITDKQYTPIKHQELANETSPQKKFSDRNIPLDTEGVHKVNNTQGVVANLQHKLDQEARQGPVQN